LVDVGKQGRTPPTDELYVEAASRIVRLPQSRVGFALLGGERKKNHSLTITGTTKATAPED